MLKAQLVINKLRNKITASGLKELNGMLDESYSNKKTISIALNFLVELAEGKYRLPNETSHKMCKTLYKKLVPDMVVEAYKTLEEYVNYNPDLIDNKTSQFEDMFEKIKIVDKFVNSPFVPEDLEQAKISKCKRAVGRTMKNLKKKIELMIPKYDTNILTDNILPQYKNEMKNLSKNNYIYASPRNFLANALAYINNENYVLATIDKIDNVMATNKMYRELSEPSKQEIVCYVKKKFEQDPILFKTIEIYNTIVDYSIDLFNELTENNESKEPFYFFKNIKGD